MYKMSYVYYDLSNGQLVDTLSKAQKMGSNFITCYVPQYEQYAISEKKKKLRKTLKKTLDNQF